MQTKQMPLWAAIFILSLAQNLWASGVELRYIRIGEHHDHTRLVFEFNELPLFEDPVLSDDGKVSIAFEDASTVLPRKIPGETTERIEFLEFLKNGQDLTAQVHLSFLYAELNTFPLTDPPRLVVDIRPADTPQAVDPAPESTAPPEPQDTGETLKGEIGTEDVETATSPPASRPAAVFAAASTGETATTGKTPEDLPEEQETGLSAPTDRPPQGDTETRGRHGETLDSARGHSQPQPLGGKTNLEIYLLATLTVLSIAIVGLLATLVHRKGHLATCSKNVLESDRTNGERIEDIDIKIEKALSRMAPS